jgi:hypothetical protein
VQPGCVEHVAAVSDEHAAGVPVQVAMVPDQ